MMAVMFEIWSCKETHSVIQVLWAVRVPPVIIHCQVITVCVAVVGGQHVRKWCRVCKWSNVNPQWWLYNLAHHIKGGCECCTGWGTDFGKLMSYNLRLPVSQ